MNIEKEKNIFIKLLAFFGFIIPVFGWMIPLYLKPKNNFLQYQAKKSFLFTILFIANSIIYYLITRLIPIQYSFVEKLFWIIIISIYLILLIFHSIKVFIQKKDNSFFDRLISKIPL